MDEGTRIRGYKVGNIDVGLIIPRGSLPEGGANLEKDAVLESWRNQNVCQNPKGRRSCIGMEPGSDRSA